MQEDEDSLQIWAGGLKELTTMKADVSQYVLPTDTVLLQGQVEELHSQWEELCLKVSEWVFESEREQVGGKERLLSRQHWKAHNDSPLEVGENFTVPHGTEKERENVNLCELI